MSRFRWTALVAIVGLLVGTGWAGAQSVDVATATAATGADLAAAAAAQAEKARLAEIQANRDQTISELMGMWAPHEGAYQLEAALRAASPRQLLQVSNARSYAEVEKVLLGETASAPFALPNTLGDTTQDYVFTPVTPCRIVDTRIAGGTMAAGSTREFYVYGGSELATLQGGNASGCSAPHGEPRAVHINLTAVPGAAQGHLRVYPANVATPDTSVINYKPGINIANAMTVQTYYSIGPKEIEVYALTASDVVADVMGYYYDVGAGTGVGFMARRTSLQTIPNAIKTTVIFNTEDYDLGADYNTTTGIFTVPATGRYNLNCHLLFGIIPSGVYRVNIYLQRNGVDFAATWGDNPANNEYVPRMISGTWSFTAGDTITCNAFVGGAAVSVFQDSGYSYFSMVQIP